MSFRNPAFLLPQTLEAVPISRLNYCTSAMGKFDDTTRGDMSDALSAYAGVAAQKTLAVFFHGGLVSKGHGTDGAERLYGPYAAEAAQTPAAGITADSWGNAYPYFFVWESGLLETLEHNLKGIIDETIFRRMQDLIAQKAAPLDASAAPAALHAMSTLDAAGSAGAAPLITDADIMSLQRAVEDDPDINAEKRKIAETAQPVGQALLQSLDSPTRTVATSSATLMSPDIVNAIVAEEAQRDHATAQGLQALWNPVEFGRLALGAGQVLLRIAQRYRDRRNHSFHNTVVEEIFRQFYVSNIGASVWAEMKRETGQAFGADPNCVGSAMIAELLKLYESGDAGRKARVTLLGHSTGAVYISNFLAAMDAALAGKPYAAEIGFDVIFMAGAVRADVFAATLAKHGHLIRNFRAFAMHDAVEAAEILVQRDEPANTPLNLALAQIYQSSLLYFITGCLEDRDDDTPLVGMERFYTQAPPFVPGAFPDVDAVRAFYAKRPRSVVYSDTSNLDPQPALGLRSASHHHGGFPGENAPNGNGGTLESVCYLLRTGDYG